MVHALPDAVSGRNSASLQDVVSLMCVIPGDVFLSGGAVTVLEWMECRQPAPEATVPRRKPRFLGWIF